MIWTVPALDLSEHNHNVGSDTQPISAYPTHESILCYSYGFHACFVDNLKLIPSCNKIYVFYLAGVVCLLYTTMICSWWQITACLQLSIITLTMHINSYFLSHLLLYLGWKLVHLFSCVCIMHYHLGEILKIFAQLSPHTVTVYKASAPAPTSTFLFCTSFCGQVELNSWRSWS